MLPRYAAQFDTRASDAEPFWLLLLGIVVVVVVLFMSIPFGSLGVFSVSSGCLTSGMCASMYIIMSTSPTDESGAVM